LAALSFWSWFAGSRRTCLCFALAASLGDQFAEALGWVEPLPAELGALFHRVIGTLVRLIEPRR
jgi:hypothetical protein